MPILLGLLFRTLSCFLVHPSTGGLVFDKLRSIDTCRRFRRIAIYKLPAGNAPPLLNSAQYVHGMSMNVRKVIRKNYHGFTNISHKSAQTKGRPARVHNIGPSHRMSSWPWFTQQCHSAGAVLGQASDQTLSNVALSKKVQTRFAISSK